MTLSILQEKSYQFSLKIISIYKTLTTDQKEFILSKQLLRSATSIGALVREAVHAQSSKDFLNKLNIALKEANETLYWLDLLHESGYIISDEIHTELYNTCLELLKMLIASVKTTKRKLGIPNHGSSQ